VVGDEVAGGIDAEDLLGISGLLDAEVLGQGEAAPADAEDAGAGGAGDIDDADQFVPVRDLFPRQLLDGCPVTISPSRDATDWAQSKGM
jgi:hypothetical protein